jgi:predicted nucleotidyltransferase
MSAAPDLSRYADFLAWLDAQGENDPDLRCAWIGGSVATGGYDEWSDLDIEALCTPGTVNAVYERMVKGLREEFAPTSLWELPATSYPDGRQCFVTFDPAPGALDAPTRLVDIVLWDTSKEHQHLDVRRHGTPLVRFDPDGLLVLEHDDETFMRSTMEETIDQIRQRRLVAEWLVNRAVERRQLPEAVSLYLRFALTPVVQLLRARDCPERHDFGLRYLHTDLHAEDAARIDALLPGVDRLRELSAECFAWQVELLGDESG